MTSRTFVASEEKKINRLKTQKLGINLIYIPKLPKIKRTFCPPNFYVDKTGKEVYFPIEETHKTYLSSLNISTSKHKIFRDKEYGNIGLFSLSPDQKKLAYYYFKGPTIRIDILDIEKSIIIKSIPGAYTIVPNTPLRVTPVWDNKSKKIYYMSLKNKTLNFGLYSSLIDIKGEKYIRDGAWPESLSNRNKLLFTTANTETPLVKILNLQNNNEKTLLKNAGNAKFSFSERYISYINPSINSGGQLMVHDLITKKNIIIRKNGLRPTDYWWIKLSGSQN